jgi:hypothetical protein
MKVDFLGCNGKAGGFVKKMKMMQLLFDRTFQYYYFRVNSDDEQV